MGGASAGRSSGADWHGRAAGLQRPDEERLRLVIVCHASLGGSSRVATRLAHALERRGHSVSLVSAAPPPAPPKELAGIRLESFGVQRERGWTTTIEQTWDPLRLRLLERRVEAVVRRDGADVVHYHYAWPFAAVVGRLKARLGAAAPAFIGTLHGTDVTQPPARASLGDLCDTDVYTTVSRAYAELAHHGLELPRRPFVVPNFVDPADFPRSSDFARGRGGSRKPRLVHVSNFRSVKNLEDVVRIFAAVRRRQPTELWLVGEGPGLVDLQAGLRQAGLDSDVRTFGYVSDVGLVLAECDVLLMTSWQESFCLAALEAMASGLCVVATAVGGLREMVEHGRTGMLFPAGDHHEGSRLVLRLLADDELRLRMRRCTARRARSLSARLVVPRYEALYRLVGSSIRLLDEPRANEAV